MWFHFLNKFSVHLEGHRPLIWMVFRNPFFVQLMHEFHRLNVWQQVHFSTRTFTVMRFNNWEHFDMFNSKLFSFWCGCSCRRLGTTSVWCPKKCSWRSSVSNNRSNINTICVTKMKRNILMFWSKISKIFKLINTLEKFQANFSYRRRIISSGKVIRSWYFSVFFFIA